MLIKDLRRFGLAALLLALATLGAIAYLLHRTSHNLQEAFTEADRVRRVLSLNDAILDLLRDAETGQRGFLITGRDNYLESYNTALRTLP